ncbi:hypothetical protein RKE29_29285 [Streptomyces sp. B1866]|uniref:type II toxin-antitoxin system RelE family toxin n=1 Tax=Streptomyces sp. B1866 TaxID=3075431 RepID=UPI0028905079|nr:hypothetical protein [Streptomyces sp. B1866]MDT3400648.1 hypothetical protein [Streptomyces sp. B1866]
MAYEVRFVTEARRQRDSLGSPARRELEKVLNELRRDPYRKAKKGAEGVWWRDFGGSGQVMYLVSDQIVTVTVLRLTYV